jgi:SPP1 gp7 family putative phage head morphogenesis protein
MRLPWQRKPKTEPASPIDLEALAASLRAELAAEIRSEARAEVVEEITRALAPMPAVAPTPGGPPRPIYAWDRPIYYSTPQAPSRHPGSQVTVDMLRALAENYDVLRACINHLKREVCSVPIEISTRNAKDTSDATKKRLAEARALFSTAGGIGGLGKPREHFEKECVEDILVIGACAVFHERNRLGGAFQSYAIDAATIRPYVDAYGWSDPARAWEQWVYGMQVATFAATELTYDGIDPRSYSPFFKSPIEYLLVTVKNALAADQWNGDWLTEGNTPADMLAVPENWTPEQLIQYQQFFDAMLSGDIKRRVKTKFVPSGSQKVGSTSRKDQDFSEFELWLLRRTCAILGVQPASIGFAGEQYKVSQENSMEQTSAFGAGDILAWRKRTYDDLLERNGYGDFECHNVTTREAAAKEKAETNEILIRSGQRTINECRQTDGEDTIDGGEALLVATTVQPLDRALNPPEPPAPVQLPPATGKGVGGIAGKQPAGAPAAGRSFAYGRRLLSRQKLLRNTGPLDPADVKKNAEATLQRVAREFRRALRANEDAAVAVMREAWATAEAAIRERLDALTAAIEAAELAGEVVSEAWLHGESRLADLLRQIDAATAEFAPAAAAAVTDGQAAMVETAHDSAYRLAAAAAGPSPDKATAFPWNALPKAQVEALVGFCADGSPVADRLLAFGAVTRQKVTDALIVGVSQGKGADQIRRTLEGILGTERARAENWARTEPHRAAREATRLNYQANRESVTGWYWLSATDARTCGGCWAMHGTLHGLDEHLDGHCQCRCVMCPRTRSWAEILGDADLPDTRPVIESGADLFARLDLDRQRSVLGPELHALYADGTISLADVVSRSSDPAWGTMRSTASVAEALQNAGQTGGNAIRAELTKWERKAIGRIKSGKTAPCPFESALLPSALRYGVYAGLATCTTVADVRGLFQSLEIQS